MNYTVDIPICVYNHERYLEQTLGGIVKQNTNFKFRIIIADDCSTDKSREILESFAAKFPEIVFPFFHQSNLGAQANSYFVFSKCTSNFIALCDGDDYWTDPNKLQKQVDFLEANPEFSMCFTNHATVNHNGEIISESSVNPGLAKNLSHEDILANNYFIGTASVLFRKDALPEPLPQEFFKVANGDYFIYSLVTRKGKAAYLDSITTAYRIHGTGVWTSRNTTQKYWAMYKTFLVSKQVFTEALEREALTQNLIKILQNLSWAYFELPKMEQLKFIFKSFFISIRFGVFKTWISINSELMSLFFKNKFKFKTA